MSQLLLMPDPRPLVERLGPNFFLKAPQAPGVYLMRDCARTVLYVGKAKNLRRRLGTYRVANPDRLRKRHLRLLRRVAAIDFEICASETAALAREAELLETLKPRFNRAGTWRGPQRYFVWRVEPDALVLSVTTSHEENEGSRSFGPIGSSAVYLRAALARRLWCALHSDQSVSALPAGWFAGRHTEETRLQDRDRALLEHISLLIEGLLQNDAASFENWVRDSFGQNRCPFDTAVLEADIEYLNRLSASLNQSHDYESRATARH
jgi:hypothetical protein